MAELKPCPFCGSLPEIISRRPFVNKTKWYWVQCQRCKAETADRFNIDDAVSVWNKRS